MDSENAHKKSKFGPMHHEPFFEFHFLLTHSSLNHIERFLKIGYIFYFALKIVFFDFSTLILSQNPV